MHKPDAALIRNLLALVDSCEAAVRRQVRYKQVIRSTASRVTKSITTTRTRKLNWSTMRRTVCPRN